MKAILLHEHGGPEKLTYGEIETPQPGPGEVQVSIKAAALNRLDLWTRNGYPGLKVQYPYILGGDGSGVVSTVGDGVTRFKLGDRVVINGTLSCGECDMCLAGKDNLCRTGGVLGETAMRGTYAEHIVLPERNLLHIPDHLSFEEASAASLVYLTAYHSLFTKGSLQPGESVLVIGAGGGANTAYIQLAHMISATVYVVGSSGEKLDQAKAIGADHVIDRITDDWGKAVFTLTGKRGVDVVVDNVGQDTWPTSLRALARGGRMLVVGNTSGYDVHLDSRYIFGKHLSIIGSSMGTQADFRKVMGLVFDRKVKPVIGCVLPLEKAAEAHQMLEHGSVFGKIILTP
jgi:NADPH:quinone reductase-like Zn-dependent oxidoreductase